MTVTTIDVGAVRLTRVSYADVEIPPEAVGLTAEKVNAVGWAEPTWANAGQVRAAAAAWIIESDDARIVVDPAQAADDILRNDKDAVVHQEAFAELLTNAEFPRESVTHAIATHVEGIGMFAWRDDDGSWRPFFPNAPLLVSRAELDAFDRGEHLDDGVLVDIFRRNDTIRATGEREPVTRDVTLELTGAHSPGHQIVRIESRGEHAIVVGHLAVSPLHLATGPCPPEHPDPAAAWATLTRLRDEDAILIGPLWPTPGAGRWDGERLAPVENATP